jgi:MFS family permease
VVLIDQWDSIFFSFFCDSIKLAEIVFHLVVVRYRIWYVFKEENFVDWLIKYMDQRIARNDSSTSDCVVSGSRAQTQQARITQPLIEEHASHSSLIANVVSTLLLRIASRVSFVLLSFYLGEHFTSATVVAMILEAFYITELALSPFVGSLSDRLGRKPFLLVAPIAGSMASLSLFIGALLFPHPDARLLNIHTVMLLLLVLLGRLLEGSTTALNTPASLGYITDATVGREKLRTRMMTAFEVATAAAMALAIPFAGKLSSWLGIWGFLVVIMLHLVNVVLVCCCVKEHGGRPVAQKSQSRQWSSLFESFKLLRRKQIFTFLPAWLCINTLVGAWLTLMVIILTYPDPAANQRHPGQLLYGGFSKAMATSLLGGFGLLLLLSMGLWTLLLPRFRRTTVMSFGLMGLAICIATLTYINGLANDLSSLSNSDYRIILLLAPALVLGVFLLSGFAPAALTQMAAISETMPTQRGAVMGLYSVVLSIGQLLGASLGGMSVDLSGFYGLMVFSAVLGLGALLSVLYMRMRRYDVIQAMSGKLA